MREKEKRETEKNENSVLSKKQHFFSLFSFFFFLDFLRGFSWLSTRLSPVEEIFCCCVSLAFFFLSVGTMGDYYGDEEYGYGYESDGYSDEDDWGLIIFGIVVAIFLIIILRDYWRQRQARAREAERERQQQQQQQARDGQP